MAKVIRKTATYIKDMKKWQADAKLFQLSHPLEGHDYVVVSAISVFGMPETYIFGANSRGTVDDWTELDGSMKGELSHSKALGQAGYRMLGTKGIE
jgi:hypothetical protein